MAEKNTCLGASALFAPRGELSQQISQAQTSLKSQGLKLVN